MFLMENRCEKKSIVSVLLQLINMIQLSQILKDNLVSLCGKFELLLGDSLFWPNVKTILFIYFF